MRIPLFSETTLFKYNVSTILSPIVDGLVQTPPISDSFLSDHCTVLSELTLRMPATTVKEVCYRKTKAIDIEAFKDDLRKSRLCQDPPVVLTDLVSCYGSTMTSLLDKQHFRRRLSRFVCGFLGSITKSRKLSVYVDGMKEYGEGQGSSQTG